jgi:predicted transcriptional regulator
MNIKQRVTELLDNFDQTNGFINNTTYNTTNYTIAIVTIGHNIFIKSEFYDKITITSKSTNKKNIYYIDSRKVEDLMYILNKASTKLDKISNKRKRELNDDNDDIAQSFKRMKLEKSDLNMEDVIIEKLHNKLKRKRDHVFIQEEEDELPTFKKLKVY